MRYSANSIDRNTKNETAVSPSLVSDKSMDEMGLQLNKDCIMFYKVIALCIS